ncbi:MAG: esterase-like activity of phytase family protein [Geminicoccaceae bacterium]
MGAARLRWRRAASFVGAIGAKLLPLAALALASCRLAAADADRIAVVPLPASEVPARFGQLEVIAAYELRSGNRHFGGISAARFDGSRLRLLSDRSRLFTLEWPERVPGGAFDVPVTSSGRLTDESGRQLDSEALAIAADGQMLVADEGGSRIYSSAPGGGRSGVPVWRLPTAFAAGAAENRGVESLVSLADGSLLAIGEGPDGPPGSHPAAIRSPTGEFRVGDYLGDPTLDPADAAAAGSSLLVLERGVSLLAGWRVRIVAVPLGDLGGSGTGLALAGRELATVSGRGVGENYEGLAVRAEADGTFRLFLVADDNFSPFQRTLLLELRWRP